MILNGKNKRDYIGKMRLMNWLYR